MYDAVVKITVRQALEAMKKNGWPKGRRIYIKHVDGQTVAACAVGQACLNLNIASVSAVHSGIDMWVMVPKDFRYKNEIYFSIAQLNDETELTVPEIADLLFARAEELGNLDMTIAVS